MVKNTRGDATMLMTERFRTTAFLAFVIVVLAGFLLSGPVARAEDEEGETLLRDEEVFAKTESKAQDLSKLKSAASKAEKAFSSGNVSKIKAIMDPDALDESIPKLNSMPKATLKDIGKAFKTRKLLSISDTYGRFQITYKGGKYVETFKKQPDGSWLLYDW